MKPPVLPEPECVWCGRVFVSFPVLRQHVKVCRQSKRPRGEVNRERLELPESTTESLYGYKAIEPLSKDDARFVDEIVSERKLLTVDGKWVCSCGGYPMGTVGSVKEDEVTKVVTVFAVHILQRSRALCCRR